MKKIKIEIKNRWTGKIIFEYESENNTIKNTVLKAISSSADLRSADLRSADLRSADLRYADLSYADLRSADLRSADLSYADLRSADLRYADLSYADLSSADLSYADLRSADLSYADLRSADLRSADLRSADLRYADLSYADLRSADLRSADLSYADLRSKDIARIKHLYQIIPEEGSFIAWKKLTNGCIAKLEIPSKSKRTCNFINRKCRAKYVKTLQIIDRNGNDIKEMCGQRDKNTIYKVNRLTRADSFDDNMLADCTHGIHFFVTKQEAKDW